MEPIDLYGQNRVEDYLRNSGFRGTDEQLQETAEKIFNYPKTEDNLICLVGRDQKGSNHKVQWAKVHQFYKDTELCKKSDIM